MILIFFYKELHNMTDDKENVERPARTFTDQEFKSAIPILQKGRIVSLSVFNQFSPKSMRNKMLTPQWEKVSRLLLGGGGL